MGQGRIGASTGERRSRVTGTVRVVVNPNGGRACCCSAVPVSPALVYAVGNRNFLKLERIRLRLSGLLGRSDNHGLDLAAVR